MIEYYAGTKVECEALNAIININCGWPDGSVTNWAIPKETIVSNLYAIPVPQGSHGFTKAHQNNGITNETIVDVEFPELGAM